MVVVSVPLAEPPVLVTVKTSLALLAPSRTPPKSLLAGEIRSAPEVTALPVSVAVAVPPVLAVTVRSALLLPMLVGR